MEGGVGIVRFLAATQQRQAAFKFKLFELIFNRIQPIGVSAWTSSACTNEIRQY